MYTQTFPVDVIRRDFPILATKVNAHPIIYFDNAATTQKPLAVIESINTYYRYHNAPVHRGVYKLAANVTELYEKARQHIAQFINAPSADQIIFTRGATEAINLIANSFGQQQIAKGDIILVSMMEHHSNIVPWQQLCQRKGAILKVIPLTEAGDIDLQAYRSLLEEYPVKIVAIIHVSNVLGAVNPIAQMTQLAHQHHASIVVDGAQAISHMSVDMQALDCDFYVCSGHKIYGPTGIGFLYGKAALLNVMPPYQTGGAMIETVTFEQTRYAAPPQRFEAGTPNIAGVLGLDAALSYLERIGGMPSIEAHEKALLTYLYQKLQDLPSVQIIGAPAYRAALLSLTVHGVHPHDLATFLDHYGITARAGHHCAMPLLRHYQQVALLRFSLGLYNTRQEIDSVVKRLQQAVEELGHG